MKCQFPIFKSIRVKLVAVFMLIALFSVAMTTISVIGYEKNNSATKEAHRLDSIAEILAPTLTAAVVFRDDVTANELILPLLSDKTVIDATVVTSGDEQFAQLKSEHKDKELQHQNYVIKKALIHEGADYGELIIRANDLAVQEHIEAYSQSVVIIAAITLTISLGLALFLSRYMIRPILTLGKVANQVTQSNNYSLRAAAGGNDEIGALTRCFNLMLENIEQRDSNLEQQVRERTTELEVVNDKLHLQAYNDSLTDLPNRRYLNKKLLTYIADYESGQSKGFSILFLDLDGFKEVNDTLGHDAGDVLLIAVAKRLQAAVRQTDLVARLGGDEFTILLKDDLDRTTISTIAENIRTKISEPFAIIGEEITITTSIGIAIFPLNGDSADIIVKCADLAMYEAKGDGRNYYKYFDSQMLHRVVEKRAVVVDLKTALLEQQFELYFQPIIDLKENLLVKVEALVRWNHPTKGIVYPDDFIPTAEEFGIINDIGEWVFLNASSHVPILQQLFGPDVQISVNVSPSQLKGDFKWIEACLEQNRLLGYSSNSILIEITENLLMKSDDITRSRLKQLKSAGVEIAIDDFGVGHSSLSYLQQIELDILKIDRSFVQNLASDPNSQALCKAMINMADELGIKVIAEGIEEAEQARLLQSYGCSYGQGYYFCKPVPLDVLAQSDLAYRAALQI